MADINVVKPYIFRGSAYLVSVAVTTGQLAISIEERVTGNLWKGTFNAKDVEELTEKTGHYKGFEEFVSMIRSALMQTNEAVTLDLLTSSDLKLMHGNWTGAQSNPALTDNHKKRFLLLINSIAPNSAIKYPLRLRYADPVDLQETIRRLQEENLKLKQQRQKDYVLKELETLKTDYDRLLRERNDLEAEFMEHKRRMESTGSNQMAAKEILVLKDFIKTLEKDLADHQRTILRKKELYRKALSELDEVKASERNLQVRVKSLTNELAQYKRIGSRAFPGSMSNSNSRNSTQLSSRSLRAGSRYNSSRDSSGLSVERSYNRSKLTDRSLANRDRSSSRESCLSSRNKFAARDRSLSRERFRSPNTSAGSFRKKSLSPSGNRTQRFDPTAYQADKLRRHKENDLKKKRMINHKMAAGDSGTITRGRLATRSSLDSNGLEIRRNRTPSIESIRSIRSSIESLSDIAVQSDGSQNQRRYLEDSKRSSFTDRNGGHARPPNGTRTRGKVLSSTPDNSLHRRSRIIQENKENRSHDDDDGKSQIRLANNSSPKSKDMLDLDARLSRLQQFLIENDIKY